MSATCPICRGTDRVRERKGYGGVTLTSCIECWHPVSTECRRKKRDDDDERWRADCESRELARQAKPDVRKRHTEEREANVKRWEEEGCLGCRFSDFSYALSDLSYDLFTMYMYDDAYLYGMDEYGVPPGECHRHAPLVSKKRGEVVTAWPDVLASDTCGDREVLP
jgi:hypothetical protein